MFDIYVCVYIYIYNFFLEFIFSLVLKVYRDLFGYDFHWICSKIFLLSFFFLIKEGNIIHFVFPLIFFFFFLYLCFKCMYLSVPGLSCDTWDLLFWHVSSYLQPWDLVP